MGNDWVVIAEFADDFKCQLAVGRLIENDIEAVAVDKRDYAYKFGEIQLCVHRDDVLIAKELIKDL